MKITGAIVLLFVLLSVGESATARQPYKLSIDWQEAVAVSKLAPSVYVVNSPMMQRGSPIHAAVYQGLKELDVEYLRYMSYFTFPKLSIAALYPPKDGKTSWDFSLMDPLVLDIFKATEGRRVMMTFNTVPPWMFKRSTPVSYPDGSGPAPMEFPLGTLADASGQQLADYYARLFSWYTQGGFTDELGKYHRSGHRFEIPYWEVLNEPDTELVMSPREYTQLYDKVVAAIRKISPATKFVGLSMAFTNPQWLEYFLDSKNHAPGIPLDMISYHGYSFSWNRADGPDQWQWAFFFQVDEFVRKVDFIENIRKRLSPSTRTAINETGTLLGIGMDPKPPKIADSYWNVSGAVYAYLYMNLSTRDIDALHMSHGVGYPGFFPELTLFDWETGKPNARYRALELISKNFGPGDTVIGTGIISPSGNLLEGTLSAVADVAAQAYRKPDGTKKLLLVNKRNQPITIELPRSASRGQIQAVDGTTSGNPPRISELSGESMELSPFSISVVSFGSSDP